MENLQAAMKAKLEATGIPAKEVRCYGSQIMITCVGKGSASKWQGVLRNLCKKIRLIESLDEVSGAKKYQKVWRIWGTI